MNLCRLVIKLFRALVFVGLGLLGDLECLIHGIEYILNKLADLLDYLLGQFD